MKSNYLKTELLNIQKEYYDILKSAQPKLSSNDFIYLLDEINLFWYANRKKIELILDYLLTDSNCFVHTGASFLDVEALEHFPFAMLGNYHIIDDPVANFGEHLNKINNEPFKENLKQQILLTIEQNINILENYSEIIQILPIRLLDATDREFSVKGAQNAFLSLFNDEKLTLEEYMKKYKNINEVGEALQEHCKELIIFSDKEKRGSFENRFKDFIENSKIFSKAANESSEAYVFLSIIVGYFTQAYDILLVCLKYGLSPYLRYIIPFHNIILLTDSLPKTQELETLLFNAKVSYFLHHTVNFNDFKTLDFNDFYKKIKEIEFSKNLNKKILENIKNTKNPPVSGYIEIIEEELENILKSFTKENNVIESKN